jgi:hypothetical protein
VNEDIIALLARDEAESLVSVEEFHSSLCHEYSFLDATDQPFRSVR